MSLEETTKAITSVVSKEHKERFGQTFFGALLGQAIVFLAMLIAYVAALAFLYRYKTDLDGLMEWAGEILFWCLLLAPLAVILVFSLIPALLRGWRETRLKRLSIAREGSTPGQFRLHPYGPQDAARYVRPDVGNHAIAVGGWSR